MKSLANGPAAELCTECLDMRMICSWVGMTLIDVQDLDFLELVRVPNANPCRRSQVQQTWEKGDHRLVASKIVYRKHRNILNRHSCDPCTIRCTWSLKICVNLEKQESGIFHVAVQLLQQSTKGNPGVFRWEIVDYRTSLGLHWAPMKLGTLLLPTAESWMIMSS